MKGEGEGGEGEEGEEGEERGRRGEERRGGGWRGRGEGTNILFQFSWSSIFWECNC